jgi:hypothetical protein
MVVGVLWIIPSLVLMGLSRAPHLMTGDEMFTHAFMPPMLFSLGAVFLVIAAGGILVGWGLMHRERWARNHCNRGWNYGDLSSAVRYGSRHLYLMGSAASGSVR